METVQTSVNIITLYPCWKTAKNEPNSIVWCFCCCLYNLQTFSNIRRMKKKFALLRFLLVSLRWCKNTLKAFESRVDVWMMLKKNDAVKYTTWAWFFMFLSFHMLPHLRHMFFVVFARNIIFHSLTSSRWCCSSSLHVFSIKYM